MGDATGEPPDTLQLARLPQLSLELFPLSDIQSHAKIASGAALEVVLRRKPELKDLTIKLDDLAHLLAGQGQPDDLLDGRHLRAEGKGRLPDELSSAEPQTCQALAC